MRTRDLVPLALLVGIAAVIVVQGREMGRTRRSRAVEPREQVTGSTAPTASAQPQGAPATTGTAAAPSTANQAPPPRTIDVVIPAELRASEEPPPLRDDAVVRQQIRDNESGTYIRAILDQQEQLLVRWPQRQREALRVWIEREVSMPDWDVNYPIVAENVFSEWKEAGFPLRFDIVTDRVSSDIQIHWAPQFTGDASRRIGLTSKARDQSGWLVSAEITVATHSPDGQRLTPQEVAGVARHEIGHVLGLGHSANPKDVMYPESTTSIISEADRATLHLLYMLPPGVVK